MKNGAVQPLARLAQGLKLKIAGDATVEGRRVLRYQVVGGGARPQETDSRELPPLQYPANPDGGTGPDPATARRLELCTKEEPSLLSGTGIGVAQSGAVIGADLHGHF